MKCKMWHVMCEKVHVINYIWKQHFRIWYLKYGMWNVKHQKFHLKKKKTLSNLFHWYFNTILKVRHHSNNTDSLIFHQTFTPFPLNFPTMYYIFVTFSPLFQHSLLTFTSLSHLLLQHTSMKLSINPFIESSWSIKISTIEICINYSTCSQRSYGSRKRGIGKCH